MNIKVLGPGCANCVKLHALVEDAAARLNIEADVVKVTDMGEILGYGVMSTPALVVDEKLVLAGRVPTVDQVVELLSRAR